MEFFYKIIIQSGFLLFLNTLLADYVDWGLCNFVICIFGYLEFINIILFIN